VVKPDGELPLRERIERIRVYGKHYGRLRAQLWYAQGNQCFYHFKGCTSTNEVIAHKDHNSSNWNPDNIAASCRHCNAVISNKARAENRSVKTARKRENISDFREQRETERISWEGRRKLELAPTLELELERILSEPFPTGWLPTVANVQDRLAVITDADQQTVARWINRQVQPEGCLMLSDRTVTDGRKKRTEQIVSFKPKLIDLDDKLDLQLRKTDRQQFEKTLAGN
jgi:hypothetical protein